MWKCRWCWNKKTISICTIPHFYLVTQIIFSDWFVCSVETGALGDNLSKAVSWLHYTYKIHFKFACLKIMVYEYLDNVWHLDFEFISTVLQQQQLWWLSRGIKILSHKGKHLICALWLINIIGMKTLDKCYICFIIYVTKIYVSTPANNIRQLTGISVDWRPGSVLLIWIWLWNMCLGLCTLHTKYTNPSTDIQRSTSPSLYAAAVIFSCQCGKF